MDNFYAQVERSCKLAQELGYDLTPASYPQQYIPVVIEMLIELKSLRERVKHG